MKLKIDAIIFDFDGVIVNSGRDIANAVRFTQKQLGRPVLEEDRIIGFVGRGVENLIRRSFEGSDEATLVEAMRIYRGYYMHNCVVDTVLYNNVKSVLDFFIDKKYALVTNKPEDMTLRINEGLGVREYFKVVIGPESVSKMKPDPEGLFKVMEIFGVQPENTIMIGDSHTDIIAGRAAGVHTCGVTYGIGDLDALIKAQPDFILDDIYKLTEIIY